MKRKNRVLILIPTNSDKSYCVGKFLKHLGKIQRSGHDFEADVLFSDDTTESPNYEESIKRFGYEVVKVRATIDAIEAGNKLEVRQCLCNARNMLRQEFIKRKKYTHAFYLDSDILPPIDIIPHLLSWNKNIVSGLYWQRLRRFNAQGKQYIDYSPVAYKYQDAETYELGLDNYGATIPIEELSPSRLLGKKGDEVQLTAVGTGCLMLSRKVMEDKWQFRWTPSTRATEDMWFSIDIKKLGYRIYADSYVLCRHYAKPWKSMVRG